MLPSCLTPLQTSITNQEKINKHEVTKVSSELHNGIYFSMIPSTRAYKAFNC